MLDTSILKCSLKGKHGGNKTCKAQSNGKENTRAETFSFLVLTWLR